MEVLAHRGIWRASEERNTWAALEGALANGFGVETDFRDSAGDLIISHDPFLGTGAVTAEKFFAAYNAKGCTRALAINIKSDGLGSLLKPLLERHGITEYFCFDMSVPETLNYRRLGMRFFTRQSEVEQTPVLYKDAAGVWMDMFFDDWIQPGAVEAHLDAGKKVCLVSPELHKRPHQAFWQRIHSAGVTRWPGVIICTDFPCEAQNYFHG